MQVLIDDLVVHYERIGSGLVLILVHGWADSLSGFYEMQRSLGKDYDVIALDLPGFGQSSQPSKAWTLNDYAKCLSKFSVKLKVDTYA